MGYVIAISGDLGSGKTSVAKAVSARLGYKYLSTGRIHRDIADELGMNALELSLHAESNPEIDRRVDAVLIDLADRDENFVVDSRVAWHFIRGSFKVYLAVDPDIAADRVVSDTERMNEPLYTSIQDARERLLARRESENRRFLIKYGIDCGDLQNYNVVIDSTFLTRDQVVDKLLELISKWKMGEAINKYWISPKLLFPTEHVRQLGSAGAQELSAKMEHEGFDTRYPIEIIVSKGFYFIWNGHKRVAGALLNGLDLIPVIVLARDHEMTPTGESAEEFASAAVNMSWCYDWEDAHRFRFIKYPQLV